MTSVKLDMESNFHKWNRAPKIITAKLSFSPPSGPSALAFRFGPAEMRFKNPSHSPLKSQHKCTPQRWKMKSACARPVCVCACTRVPNSIWPTPWKAAGQLSSSRPTQWVSTNCQVRRGANKSKRKYFHFEVSRPSRGSARAIGWSKISIPIPARLSPSKQCNFYCFSENSTLAPACEGEPGRGLEPRRSSARPSAGQPLEHNEVQFPDLCFRWHSLF